MAIAVVGVAVNLELGIQAAAAGLRERARPPASSASETTPPGFYDRAVLL
jgi:hypothetical protein